MSASQRIYTLSGRIMQKTQMMMTSEIKIRYGILPPRYQRLVSVRIDERQYFLKALWKSD